MSVTQRQARLKSHLVMHLLQRCGGFTLIEVLVVIVIVGILMAVAVPTIIIHVRRSRTTEAQAALTAVRTASEVYRSDWAQYPTQGAAGYNEIKVDSPLYAAKYMDTAFTNFAPNYKDPVQLSANFAAPFLDAQGAIWQTVGNASVATSKYYKNFSGQPIDCRLGQGADTPTVINGPMKDFYVGAACNLLK